MGPIAKLSFSSLKILFIWKEIADNIKNRVLKKKKKNRVFTLQLLKSLSEILLK